MADKRPGIVFIGMETSGVLRRRFQAMGHETYSCDLLPSEDGGEELVFSSDGLPLGRHMKGDVFDCLANMQATDLWPTMAIFHPDCTNHTVSAAWAFNDPDYDRYPGVGYHQKVKPETLVGSARREQRERDENDVRRIRDLPIERKAIENPTGTLSTRVLGKPQQIFQPNWFGDDASKGTCLWLWNLPPLVPTKRVQGRTVEWPRGSGRFVDRWANQTEGGQNKLTPGPDRWKERSRTYPGPADAMVAQWGALL